MFLKLLFIYLFNIITVSLLCFLIKFGYIQFTVYQSLVTNEVIGLLYSWCPGKKNVISTYCGRNNLLSQMHFQKVLLGLSFLHLFFHPPSSMEPVPLIKHSFVEPMIVLAAMFLILTWRKLIPHWYRTACEKWGNL